MKQLFCLFFLISSISLSQNNPFKALDYDRVVAYEYQGEGDLLIEDCLINQKDKISKSLPLSREQVKKIESIITSQTAYENTTMSCFDPHMALVYYQKETIVASVSICLDCNYLESSIEIPATKLTYTKVSDDYSYPNNGFSKQTRKDIYGFCKQLGFTKYLKPLNSFLDD